MTSCDRTEDHVRATLPFSVLDVRRDSAVVANAAVIEGAARPIILVTDGDADHCFVARAVAFSVW